MGNGVVFPINMATGSMTRRKTKHISSHPNAYISQNYWQIPTLLHNVSRDFQPLFFPWFEPIWAPDKQGKLFSNSASISQRYSITKFEKIDFESLIRLFLAERDNEKEAFKDGLKYKTEKKTGRLPLQTFYYLNRFRTQKGNF